MRASFLALVVLVAASAALSGAVPNILSSSGPIPAAPPSAGAATMAGPLSAATPIAHPALTIIVPTWINVTGPVAPPATSEGSLAFDAADNETVMFGGETANASYTNDTWVEVGGHWTNETNPHDAPPARVRASMDYDPNMGGVLLFGGYDGSDLADTWLFAGGHWTDVSYVSLAPPARDGAMMAFDPEPDENGSVLFGGDSGGSTLNDTWIWEGWSGWVKANSSLTPPPLDGGGLAYDPSTGYLLLYGGLDVCGFLCFAFSNETWEFYSGEWWPVAPPANPGARIGFVMAFDPTLGRIVLFGGGNFSATFDDMWEFDGGSWFRLSPSALPSPRLDPESSSAPGPGAPMLFGGQDPAGEELADTWVYEDAPGLSVLAPPNAEVGAAVSVTVTPIRGSAPYNATIGFGDGASAAVSGPGPFLLTHVYASTGTFGISVNVTDAVGASVGLAAPIAISIGPGPSVLASASPAATDAGVPITLSASGSSTALPLSYAWSFGDAATGTGASAPHTYAAAGAYNATVTLTDADGGSASSTVTVDVHARPRVDGISASPSPSAGSPVSFAANLSGGTGPFSFSWRFGDGAHSGAAGASHVFLSAGTYTIELWANDSVGASSQGNVTIIVGPAAPSTGASSSGPSSVPGWFWVALGALLAGAVVLAVLAIRRRPR